jgi:AcrR family transcriptional regulator
MRKGERKRQVLARARALVAEQGFPATTLDHLAKAAGLTPAQIHRYFPTHAALVQAVVNDLRADTFPPPEPLANGTPDAAAQLQAWLDRSIAAAREPTVGFRVLFRALVELDDADSRAELHAMLLECSEPLVQLLHAGQHAGVFRRALDAQVAAWELLQAVLGYALIGPRDIPSVEAGEPASPFDGLLHGLLKVDV